ncbi:hypothetical protein [Paenibacillus humicola]|uniref:hypothetical protein n=1 Tax=Paenibacillus humicola TaxID=3110540 RepID=UPI00237AB294|nr:hypothetical protein [Paenibacillus humicola]
MNVVMNEEFLNETVVFEGNHYIGCSFTDCTILITSPDFDFDRCTFIGSSFQVDPNLEIGLTAPAAAIGLGPVLPEAEDAGGAVSPDGYLR